MTTRTKKSKGHIGFTKTHEYFKYGKDIYRVPIENYIDADGHRVGARFESTPAAWIYTSPRIPWVKPVRRKK